MVRITLLLVIAVNIHADGVVAVGNFLFNQRWPESGRVLLSVYISGPRHRWASDQYKRG